MFVCARGKQESKFIWDFLDSAVCQGKTSPDVNTKRSVQRLSLECLSLFPGFGDNFDRDGESLTLTNPDRTHQRNMPLRFGQNQ